MTTLKIAKYKIQRGYHIDDYYAVYKKGTFGRWKHLRSYDTLEEATKRIQAEADKALLYDEEGDLII